VLLGSNPLSCSGLEKTLEGKKSISSVLMPKRGLVLGGGGRETYTCSDSFLREGGKSKWV